MKTNMRRVSAEALPDISDDAQARLQTLQAQPDDAIDLSDIPELSDADLSGAVRGRFYRPVKQQITARIDADVLAWLKAGGKGYQSRLNAILRREMQASTTKKKAR